MNKVELSFAISKWSSLWNVSFDTRLVEKNLTVMKSLEVEGWIGKSQIVDNKFVAKTDTDGDMVVTIIKDGEKLLCHSYNGEPAIHWSKPVAHQTLYKVWVKEGVIYRDDDKPAIVMEETVDGQYILTNIWINSKGKIHRENGPSIEKIMGGSVQSQKWTNKKGKLDRENGPAHVIYDLTNGNKMAEMFYQNGKYHNEHGPAIITYADNDVFNQYYVNGNKAFVDPVTGAIVAHPLPPAKSNLRKVCVETMQEMWTESGRTDDCPSISYVDRIKDGVSIKLSISYSYNDPLAPGWKGPNTVLDFLEQLANRLSNKGYKSSVHCTKHAARLYVMFK